MLARAASLPRRAASAESGSESTGVSVTSRLPGAGGSAMPCGLVLPTARAKATLAAGPVPGVVPLWPARIDVKCPIHPTGEHMVDGENLHAVFGSTIDDSVIPLQKFPNVLATELRHHMAGKWQHAESFDGLAQPPDKDGSRSSARLVR